MKDTFLTGIERAIARSEITELVYKYANMAVENADFGGMAQLFTKDGVFVLPGGPTVPIAEIHKVVKGQEPKFIRHNITTIQIDFTSPTTADADCFAIVYTDMAQPDHWGRTRDSFRLENGKWLYCRKAPMIEGCDPKGWAGTVLMAGAPK